MTERACAASASRSPVTPSRPTRVDEAPRPGADRAAAARRGSSGAASSTVSTPAASAASAHGPTSSSGRSGRIAAGDARRRPATAAKRSWPMWKHEVVVGHHGERDAGVERRATLVEDRCRRGARRRGPARDASWIIGPSITGSENGMPISMASAPASATARTTSAPARPSPPVTYGTSSLRPGVAPARGASASSEPSATVSRHARSAEDRPSSAPTSLSPRPDRFTSTVWPGERGALARRARRARGPARARG